eukprot:5662033-Prymnesium_polylepis.1
MARVNVAARARARSDRTAQPASLGRLSPARSMNRAAQRKSSQHEARESASAAGGARHSRSRTSSGVLITSERCVSS